MSTFVLIVYLPNGMKSMARKKPKRTKVGRSGRPARMAKFVQESDLKAPLKAQTKAPCISDGTFVCAKYLIGENS